MKVMFLLSSTLLYSVFVSLLFFAIRLLFCYFLCLPPYPRYQIDSSCICFLQFHFLLFSLLTCIHVSYSHCPFLYFRCLFVLILLPSLLNCILVFHLSKEGMFPYLHPFPTFYSLVSPSFAQRLFSWIITVLYSLLARSFSSSSASSLQSSLITFFLILLPLLRLLPLLPSFYFLFVRHFLSSSALSRIAIGCNTL